jgi:hypothetical protein
MRDLIDKKNKLNTNSQKLRTLKFSATLWNSRKDVTRLIKEQNEAYKKFIFYKEFIKAQSKERKDRK